MSKIILIADDSSFMRMALKEVLITNGYSVVAEAVDGHDAICKYKAHQPDCVILNINMPKLDGVETLK